MLQKYIDKGNSKESRAMKNLKRAHTLLQNQEMKDVGHRPSANGLPLAKSGSVVPRQSTFLDPGSLDALFKPSKIHKQQSERRITSRGLGDSGNK